MKMFRNKETRDVEIHGTKNELEAFADKIKLATWGVADKQSTYTARNSAGEKRRIVIKRKGNL